MKIKDTIKSRYCLPIIQKTQSEVVDMIERNLENYTHFEIWLDYVEKLDLQTLNLLSINRGCNFIFTIRRREGLQATMSLQKRQEVITAISTFGHLLDLDINQFNDITTAKTLNMEKNLIISFHDYSRTPENVYLDKIVEKIRVFKPNIIKLSTMCNEPSDSLRLMKYKRDFLEAGERHIVLGMGEHGKITRVFGALWGNEILYIPEDESEASAAGQITRSEMDKIVERMAR